MRKRSTKAARRQAFKMILAEAPTSGQRFTFAADCTIQAQAPIEGQAARPATVNVLAYNGGELRVAGYNAPVVIALDGLQGLGRNIPLLRDHNTNRVIGFVTATRNGGSIEATGRLSGNSPDRQEVAEQAADGFPWQASVGVRPLEMRSVRAGASVEVNGRTFEGPLYVATRSRLAELTITAIGADADTAVELSISAIDDDGNNGGAADHSGTNGGNAHGGQGGSGAGGQAGNNGGDFGGNRIADIRAERARREAIEAVAVRIMRDNLGSDQEIEASMNQAIAEGRTADQFELEMLRGFSANRARGSFRTGSSNELHGDALNQAVEASLMSSMGLAASDMERHYSERVLNAMDRDPVLRRGLSLKDVLIMAGERNGQRNISRRDERAMLQAAFLPAVNASGISTIDVSGILSNVANKMVIVAFESVSDLWGAGGEKRQAYSVLGSVTPVSDFKQITSYSLTGDLTYMKVEPGGEIEHGTLGEETYTNQADTYGRMLALTRQDIRNDDLGAFRRIPTRLGRGAALKVADVFWTAFLNNTSFFTAGRGNFDDGADTEFDIDALTLAEALFLDQTDRDGKPLGVMPTALLVPTAYFASATNVMRSTKVNHGTADNQADGNPHSGKYTAWTSPYMSNSSYTGYSAKKWYLLADPMDLPVIETVFLDGRQRPTVESADADFNQLGVQIRGYHDFGCAKQEYRGGVAMKGEA